MNEAALLMVLSAICHVESGGNHRAINIHDGGSPSYGECQIKLTTARGLGFRGHVSDLWLDRRVNRYWAGQYLRRQYDRYGDWEKAIAAYNAGSLKGGKIRNRGYVKRVMEAMQ